MPMTDAPNFVAKFGWRKPCPRYIGPLLRTASVASVGRGDHTLPPQILAQNLAGGSHTPGAPRRRPPCSVAPVGGGLCPAPLARSVFAPISRWFGIPSTPCRGGPMCPPGHTSARDPFTGRHTGRPLQILLKPPSTLEAGLGQSPAPTGAKGDEHPMPVRDLPGHPQPRLPQTKTP